MFAPGLLVDDAIHAVMPPDPEMIQVGDAIWQRPRWRGAENACHLGVCADEAIGSVPARGGYTDRPAGFLPLTRDLRQSVCCRRLPRRSVGPTVDAVALVKAEVSRADVITMGIGPAGLTLVGELCPAGMRL